MADAIFRHAEEIIRSKLGLGVLIAAFTTSGCVAHSIGQVGSVPTISHPQNAIGQRTESLEKTPGIIVHIDPQTGRIITPPSTPPLGQASQPPLEAAKPQLPPLQETLSPIPGGGVMIELDDRLRTPLTATIDADGKVRFEHKSTAPGGSDNK